MHQALERGLIVSKPFGDSAPYDFIIDNRPFRRGPGRLWRVQVRSVVARYASGFSVSTTHGLHHIPLTSDDTDFLAILVVPLAAWYIIPVRAFFPATILALFPHVANSRGRWEPYRDAWRLLRRKQINAKPAKERPPQSAAEVIAKIAVPSPNSIRNRRNAVGAIEDQPSLAGLESRCATLPGTCMPGYFQLPLRGCRAVKKLADGGVRIR